MNLNSIGKEASISSPTSGIANPEERRREGGGGGGGRERGVQLGREKGGGREGRWVYLERMHEGG